ncbi:MAG: hypothetical protein AYP45_09675 [Candidatus Brocadia carolinensis]|uniref:Uncharacterized protein n=1 Tax=Candidatus Brocadia carolinensis TaxID=1004156 RepID=A0A1V4AT37_9BACT|nr:MAG: hypothetical protein AYP45_09675 [Candidatus Brocadia caroliniensis]
MAFLQRLDGELPFEGFFLRLMLVPIFFFCTETFASWLYAQDFIVITDFSQDELSWGEPVGWKTHKGICREIRHSSRHGKVEAWYSDILLRKN